MLDERLKRHEVKIQNNAVKHLLFGLLYFIAGVLLGNSSALDDLKPFGISLVAVSKKKYFIFSSVGAVIGYIIGGLDENSIRYLVGVFIAGIGAFLVSNFDLGYKPLFPMLVSFLACASTGVVLNIHLASVGQAFILVFAESVLCAGCSFFFFKSLYANYKRLRFKALPIPDIACICISVLIVLLSLSKASIGIISPARILAMIVVLSAIRYCGERLGIVLSLCFGFALSITDSESLFIVGAFAFSSMVAALFSSLSAWGIGISFLCSIAFFSVAADNDYSLALAIEGAISSACFILMPSGLSYRLDELWNTKSDLPPDGSLRQNLVLKLRFASSAMATISDSVDQVREKINDITRRENDKNRDLITEEEYIRREIILEKTNQIRMVASDQFFSIAGMLEDLAHEFDEAEIFDSNASSKIRRFLGEYEIYPKNISAIEDKFGRMRVEILLEGGTKTLDIPHLTKEIGRICSRYFEQGRLTNFKEESMLSFSERPNYKLIVGFAQHSAEGDLCGDTVKLLNDSKGHSILIISDGMGKGSRAALDGAMGAGLLSRLINAGFGFDSALKVVNSALLVKSNDESLATIDIANVDLFTGKCEIFKAGAPASYIIKNGNLTRCELSSMPAGILRGIEFAKRTAVLGIDDSMILMSDGITDLGEEWLKKTFDSLPSLDSQVNADFVLTEALKECDPNKHDDMSVIFARLERN